jgi:DNA-binding FrmR family transcriptional regulator
MSQEVSKEVLVNRLKKIEGQVRGLQKMIEQGRDCESIMTQLVAVRGAIEGVGTLVLNNYMHLCFSGAAKSDAADSLARALGIWGGARLSGP